jgi:hypothetical protein
MQSAQTGISGPRLLNLIWRRTWLDFALEGYFIREVLLGGIARPIRSIVLEDKAQWPLLSDALVISYGSDMVTYLRDARARGHRNLGLFHMGDELGEHDRSCYSLADYVIRNYWFEHVLTPPGNQCLGIAWVPNGYRTGVGPINSENALGMADRTIMGFFAGVLGNSPERQEIAAIVKEAGLPFLVMGTPSFGQGLGPVSYASYLASSRFALVPSGNSPETIRLYDALEAGAIPIMLDAPFVRAREALDSPPFVFLNAWRELPDVYSRYANTMAPRVIAELEAKRKTICEWWVNFKAKQQRKMRELIDLSFERAYRRS